MLARACSLRTFSASLMSRNATTIPIVRLDASRNGAAGIEIGDDFDEAGDAHHALQRRVTQRSVLGAQPRARDILIAAVLLVVALWPVRHAVTTGEHDYGVVGRIQVAWESLNGRFISAGEIPAWNPYQFGGRPHLADPDTLAAWLRHHVLDVPDRASYMALMGSEVRERIRPSGTAPSGEVDYGEYR